MTKKSRQGHVCQDCETEIDKDISNHDKDCPCDKCFEYFTKNGLPPYMQEDIP